MDHPTSRLGGWKTLLRSGMVDRPLIRLQRTAFFLLLQRKRLSEGSWPVFARGRNRSEGDFLAISGHPTGSVGIPPAGETIGGVQT